MQRAIHEPMTSDHASDTSPPFAWRFGEFELRPGSRQLFRGGAEIAVQGKVFDLIAYLVAHADRAVDKNELLDAVWPRQIVTEAALSRCVMKARRALEDDAADPGVLLTLHGRGYRLLLPVQRVQAAETAAAPVGGGQGAVAVDDPSASIAPSSAPGHRRWRLAAAAAVLLLVVLAVGQLARRETSLALPDARAPRVAVLPVDNRSGDDRLDWAELGLMGSIGEILRRSDGVAVLDPRTVLDLVRSPDATTRDEQLRRLQQVHGVTHVVSGAISRELGQLHFRYTLHAGSDEPRRRSVVAADVGGLAHAASADLRAVFGLRRGDHFSDDAFVNEAYLRGRALRLQGDAAAALDYFRLAAEQAPAAFWPRYEQALALRDTGEADAAIALLQQLQAEADAGSALEPQLSSRNALAILHWRAGRLALSGELLDQALLIAERQGDVERIATVLTNLGILARHRGDYPAARRHLSRAIEAELAGGKERPSANLLHSLAQVEISEGDLDAGGRHLEAALAEFRLIGDRRYEAVALNSLAHLRRRQGRLAETRELAEQALQLHRALGSPGPEASALLALADAELRLGRAAVASGLAEQALTVARDAGETPRARLAAIRLGRISTVRGEFDAAAAWLQQARQFALIEQDPTALPAVDLQFAELDLASGRTDAAAQRLQALLDAPDAHGRAFGAAVRRLMARVELARGHPRLAADWLHAPSDASSDPLPSDVEGEAALLQAEIALAAGDVDAAATALADAGRRLPGDRRLLQLHAELAARRNDPLAALDFEQRARAIAGDGWLAPDEARLQARIEAAAAAR